MAVLPVPRVEVQVKVANVLPGLEVVHLPHLHVLVPNLALLQPGELEAEDLLVDVHQARGYHLHGEILLQFLLVHGVLLLLHHGHVVPEVPEVKLAGELEAELLALRLLHLQQDLLLLLPQRLQLLGELAQELLHSLGVFGHPDLLDVGGVVLVAQQLGLLLSERDDLLEYLGVLLHAARLVGLLHPQSGAGVVTFPGYGEEMGILHRNLGKQL